MNHRRPRLKFRYSWLMAILSAIATTPAIAQTSNFGTITLASSSEPVKVEVTGYTGGSYSLSAISNRDQDRKACIGYGDPNPDHILVLDRDFTQLKILVKSGNDTTLLVKGPDDTVRCADDTGKNKDASIEGSNMKQGTYRIWVGTIDPKFKRNYTLTIQQ